MPLFRLIVAPFIIIYNLVVVILAVLYVGVGWIFTGQGYVKITWPTFK